MQVTGYADDVLSGNPGEVLTRKSADSTPLLPEPHTAAALDVPWAASTGH
jgi:hypothetical protein